MQYLNTDEAQVIDAIVKLQNDGIVSPLQDHADLWSYRPFLELLGAFEEPLHQ
jgi:hypothetical protein